MKLFAIISLSILSANIFAQGRIDGFFKQKKEVDFVIGASADVSQYFLSEKSKVKLSRTVTSLSLFSAIGLTDKFNVNLSVPFVMVNKEANLQDASVYFKYLLYQKECKSGSISLVAAAGFSDNITNYETESSSAIGKQAQSMDIRPLVHFQHNSGWFVTSQAGFISNSSPTPNAINIAVKTGLAASKFYIDFWYEFLQSDGGKNYLESITLTSFKELGTDLHKVGGTFYKGIGNNKGAFFGANYLIDGRNVGDGFGINAGIVFKLKK